MTEFIQSEINRLTIENMLYNDNKYPDKIITSESNSIKGYLIETWHYKNFIIPFAKQEFKVQYVQTKFNIFWVILRPLLIAAIFTFIFDKMIHIDSLKYPYPLFAISGLIVWNNFTFMCNNAGNVLVSNQQLIKKIYFPRIILVLSKVIISMVEVVVTLILLLILMAVWKYPIQLDILFSPIFIFIGLLTGTAISIWLNALTIRYRDLHQFAPTFVGFMIWLTPVFYPVTLVPKRYSFLLYINPIAGAIQGFRWSVLGDTFPNIWFLPSFLFSVIILISGLIIFIRAETDLADYI